LHYTVEVLADDPPDDQADQPPGARQWLLAVLRAGGPHQTVKQLGDATAAQGHPLRKRTIQEALAELEARGLVIGTEQAPGLPRYWSATSPPDQPTEPADPGGGER
jgi:hypothetical protein